MLDCNGYILIPPDTDARECYSLVGLMEKDWVIWEDIDKVVVGPSAQIFSSFFNSLENNGELPVTIVNESDWKRHRDEFADYRYVIVDDENGTLTLKRLVKMRYFYYKDYPRGQLLLDIARMDRCRTVAFDESNRPYALVNQAFVKEINFDKMSELLLRDLTRLVNTAKSEFGEATLNRGGGLMDLFYIFKTSGIELPMSIFSLAMSGKITVAELASLAPYSPDFFTQFHGDVEKSFKELIFNSSYGVDGNIALKEWKGRAMANKQAILERPDWQIMAGTWRLVEENIKTMKEEA